MHLYLHVPFCTRRCSYCDFAIAVRRAVPARAYADAVIREWEGWQDHPIWLPGVRLDTIYFGGGTPSLLDTPALERILDRVRQDRVRGGPLEVTLEANPENVTAAAARDWHRLGINRISLGAQSFDPPVLRWMHRTHEADAAPRAVATLREAGIANISLDLIFGLPRSLHRDWARDLDQALALEPDHLSVYGLTVEDHTPLARWVARGESQSPPDEDYSAEFLLAHHTLGSAGFQHYEVSNYARPGYRSRHNSAYWDRRPYLGLGPSAHSGWGHHRQWNLREWTAWLDAVESGRSPVADSEDLGPAAVELETLYLGLRRLEGIPAERIPASARRGWVDSGWAIQGSDHFQLTPEGWLRLDALVGSLRSPAIA